MKIKVKIGDGYYLAEASALTALRYRAHFNRSAMNGFENDDILDLLYVAVWDDKIPYEKFIACKLNKKHLADMHISAYAVFREIMKDSGVKQEVIKKADEKIQDEEGFSLFDEFGIVSSMTVIGLSFDIWQEVSLIQLMYIVARSIEMKCGKTGDDVKMTKMSRSERKQIYSITKEDEDRIREYLKENPPSLPIGVNCM